jgi:hypothetical protein
MRELERVSQAILEQLKANPHLAFHVARSIHGVTVQQGLISPGIGVFVQRMNTDSDGGGDPKPPPHPHGPPGPPGPPPPPPQPGAVKVEAFWWGFHFVFPHDVLVYITTTADVINTVVELIGPETGPAAPFVELAAALVQKMIDNMRNMDVGNGIYFSMTWLLPGVFVPTPI